MKRLLLLLLLLFIAIPYSYSENYTISFGGTIETPDKEIYNITDLSQDLYFDVGEEYKITILCSVKRPKKVVTGKQKLDCSFNIYPYDMAEITFDSTYYIASNYNKINNPENGLMTIPFYIKILSYSEDDIYRTVKFTISPKKEGSFRVFINFNPAYVGIDNSTVKIGERIIARKKKSEHLKSEAEPQSNNHLPLTSSYSEETITMYNDGNKFFMDEKYFEAFICYRKAATAGHIDAQYQLGICYEGGYGVPQNIINAEYWFEKAAGQGYPLAKVHLDNLKSRVKKY